MHGFLILRCSRRCNSSRRRTRRCTPKIDTEIKARRGRRLLVYRTGTEIDAEAEIRCCWCLLGGVFQPKIFLRGPLLLMLALPALLLLLLLLLLYRRCWRRWRHQFRRGVFPQRCVVLPRVIILLTVLIVLKLLPCHV